MDLFRLFKTTTSRTSHVGQPGLDSPENWRRFFEKYHDSCVTLLGSKYPQWKSDAEDAVQSAFAEIAADPDIIRRGANDSFRSVLGNLCVKQMRRIHPPHRLSAIQKFNAWLRVKLQPSRLGWDADAAQAILATIQLIRTDLLRSDYENGRYFKHLKKDELDLWRQVQQSELNDTELSVMLGIPYKRLNRAKNNIDRWIIDETVSIAKRHGYLA